jgi:transposase-like protein
VQQRGVSVETKRQALQLYLEGLGFRSIGRFLKCSHVAVYNWIRAHGESIDAIRSAAGVEVVEMDEMHTYIGSKKTTAGFGLLLIDMGNGSSTAKWAAATPARAGSSGIQSRTTA